MTDLHYHISVSGKQERKCQIRNTVLCSEVRCSLKARQGLFIYESRNVCVHAYLCVNSESSVRMTSLGTEPLTLSAFLFQTNAKLSPTSCPSFCMWSTRNWPVQHTAEMKDDLMSFSNIILKLWFIRNRSSSLKIQIKVYVWTYL